MRVCLVFPKSTFLIDPLVYPPLGLWYLAAQLEAQGHETDFRDLTCDTMPEDGEFDQVWISATSPQMHEVRKLALLTGSWKHTATVLGGAAPWARLDECSKMPFDLVVGGESDHPDTVRMIVDEASKILHGVRPKSGVALTPAITPGPLNWVLPPVRRWDVKYHTTLQGHNGRHHRTTTLFTSRGCPMACAFCESGRNGVIWDRFVRYEPLSLVEAQLREIAERGHTGVCFHDDILPLNKPRTLGIMQLLKRYGLIWRCFLRTDVISKQGGFDYLRELADAGLVEVLVGVESADQRIKDNVHKGTTIEQDTQVRAWCRQLGIRFKSLFILGLPGEDADSMARTRAWIFEHRPDRIDVGILIPFPGTPITRSHDYAGAEYDLYWTEKLPEEYFYKGQQRKTNALVGTSALRPAEIETFRNALVADIIAAGIPY